MRTAFIDRLCVLAAADERIWLVCGDLGYSVLEAFADRFPSRFLNAGVAEQNMTGIAAGLALTGKTVFTYSIANFPVMRCLEQIRNDVCYHNLNVKVVAVGGGLAYSSQGYTHHGVEDLAVMSALPNLVIAAPGDPIEAEGVTELLVSHPGPAYLRLGKAGEPRLHAPEERIQLGKSIRVLEGDDLTIISIGGMLGTALDAAKGLRSRGISATLLSMPFLLPLDTEAILNAARRTRRIITVEEHGPGGLGSAVAETIALAGEKVSLECIRLMRAPIKLAGSQQQLCAAQGLSPQGIISVAERMCSTVATVRG
jgi:transketolase